METSFSVLKPILALCLTCALPTVAHAALIYDTITVIDAGGNILAAVTATQAEITANPFAFFYVPGIAVNRGQFNNPMLVTVGGVAVDIVGIATAGPDGLDLAFSPGAAASSSTLTNVIAATGAPIDLTQYLSFTLLTLGDTASFTVSGNLTSMPDPVGSVPEPLTWALMVAGFAALGSSMRRNTRAARAALAYT